MRVSVIIPALNESRHIDAVLRRTAEALAGHEIILVDGGESGGPTPNALALDVRVIRSSASRGAALNEGARRATGDVLLFLHADTLLPPNAEAAMALALTDARVVGGAFRLRFDHDSMMAHVIERWVHARSLIFNVFLGDQALFVKKDVFLRAGGFRDWNLMEDLEVLGRLRRFGRLRLVHAPVVTSARRHVRRGWLRTTGTVWLITWLYFFGVPTRVLAGLYRRGR